MMVIMVCRGSCFWAMPTAGCAYAMRIIIALFGICCEVRSRFMIGGAIAWE
ncbi:MAG: hypothetical protein ACM65L_08845 [Microcoleus sp.]